MTSTPRLGRPLLINPKDAPMTGTPRFVRFCKKMKKAAKRRGHDPLLINHLGNLALFGCRNCRDTCEVWDAPEPHAGGPMTTSHCDGVAVP